MDAVKQAFATVSAWILDHKKLSGAVLLVVLGFILAKAF